MGNTFLRLLLLPLRSLLYGVGKMAETFQGIQRMTEESLDDIARPPGPTGAPGTPPSGRRSPTGPAGGGTPSGPDGDRPSSAHATPQITVNPQITVVPAAGGLRFHTPPRPTLHSSENDRGSQGPHSLRDQPKEDNEMYMHQNQGIPMDQDLSGDMVKVVQYSIVNVVPGIADNERVVAGPCIVAFSDDMTGADFTAWIIAEQCPDYGVPTPKPHDHGSGDSEKDCECHQKPCHCKDITGPNEFPCYPGPNIEKCFDRKYLRVAYSVMGRFAVADIDWNQLQAISVAKIAEKLIGWPPPPNPAAGSTQQTRNTKKTSD